MFQYLHFRILKFPMASIPDIWANNYNSLTWIVRPSMRTSHLTFTMVPRVRSQSPPRNGWRGAGPRCAAASARSLWVLGKNDRSTDRSDQRLENGARERRCSMFFGGWSRLLWMWSDGPRQFCLLVLNHIHIAYTQLDTRLIDGRGAKWEF